MTGDPSLTVEPHEWLAGAVELRDSGFTWFDWLSAVDLLDATDRPGFDVVLHLYRPPGAASGAREVLSEHWMRTRLPTGVALASITPVYPGAAWHERETYEMFGIEFTGFDDGTGLGMRRLLVPPEVRGYPLTKEFPLPARAVPPPGVRVPGRSGAGGRSREDRGQRHGGNAR